MLVMKYECECIKTCNQSNHTKIYWFKTNNSYYLTVPGDVWLNQLNRECEGWIINVSASKIWNESNGTKIVFNENKQMHLPFLYQRCPI